jgi:hypothetical protein
MRQIPGVVGIFLIGCSALTLVLADDDPIAPTYDDGVLFHLERCDGDGCSSPGGTDQGGIADCTDMQAYQQPFNFGAFRVGRISDHEAGLRVFENFYVPGPTVATHIRAWGIELDPEGIDFLCPEDDTANFDVVFWGSSAGVPDPYNQIAELNDLPATETDTGVSFHGFLNIVQIDIDLGELDITGAVWASIARVNDEDSCYWLWVDEDLLGTYDDQAYQEGGDGLVTTDQPFCLDSGFVGDGGGVPATTGIGVALTILLLAGSSAYFMRRKDGSKGGG